jgi:hypothetical protein
MRRIERIFSIDVRKMKRGDAENEIRKERLLSLIFLMNLRVSASPR